MDIIELKGSFKKEDTFCITTGNPVITFLSAVDQIPFSDTDSSQQWHVILIFMTPSYWMPMLATSCDFHSILFLQTMRHWRHVDTTKTQESGHEKFYHLKECMHWFMWGRAVQWLAQLSRETQVALWYVMSCKAVAHVVFPTYHANPQSAWLHFFRDSIAIDMQSYQKPFRSYPPYAPTWGLISLIALDRLPSKKAVLNNTNFWVRFCLCCMWRAWSVTWVNHKYPNALCWLSFGLLRSLVAASPKVYVVQVKYVPKCEDSFLLVVVPHFSKPLLVRYSSPQKRTTWRIIIEV